MAEKETLQLLNRILAGEVPTMDDINCLIQRKVPEDEYCDYKSGEGLAKPTRSAARETIRQYVAAFANAVGGMVIYGVKEQMGGPNDEAPRPLSLAPVDWASATELSHWADSCLTDFAGQVRPPPRVRVIEVALQKYILIVATSRADVLVRLVEQRQLRHYFRLGNQTLPAPDWLVWDLTLGRRSQPVVRLADMQVDLSFASHGQFVPCRNVSLSAVLKFNLFNESLVWMDQISIGLVALSSVPQAPAADIIRASCDVTESKSHDLAHIKNRPVEGAMQAAPFAVVPVVRGEVTFILDDIGDEAEVWSAIYVASRGHNPCWFQARFRVYLESMPPLWSTTIELARAGGHNLDKTLLRLMCTPLTLAETGDRPRVALEVVNRRKVF